jgi:UDP-4-amino-4,6-dideoxy-N-acetyl-beta-L-altrosamine N-acetyltransferase
MRLWRNSPNVRENMYTRHEISSEEHLTWWSRTENREDQKYFMYECKEVPTGIVAFTAIDKDNLNSSWAFYASPKAEKGTGSKMEFLALDYAFGALGLHKLSCEVLAFNAPVIKLHQKFGFKIEGIFREQHSINENYVDIYRLGMLGVEWNAQRQGMKNKIEAFSKE